MLEYGFYNMDCMDGMKNYPDNYFDLAIVDPPYGINICGGGAQRSEEPSRSVQVGGASACRPKSYKAFDDSHVPGAEYFKELNRVAKKQIIWGGNYFLDYLQAAECLLIWDKARRGLAFADCEIAWTNFKSPSRIFEFKWNGMLQGDMKNKEYRIHPTQKPVRLYTWLLSKYAKPGDVILDTHVGSGSSLIACEQLGYKYVGFEIDPDYYKDALKRIQEERRQIKWQLGT